jgi:hypothetical protein
MALRTTNVRSLFEGWWGQKETKVSLEFELDNNNYMSVHFWLDHLILLYSTFHLIQYTHSENYKIRSTPMVLNFHRHTLQGGHIQTLRTFYTVSSIFPTLGNNLALRSQHNAKRSSLKRNKQNRVYVTNVSWWQSRESKSSNSKHTNWNLAYRNIASPH